MALTVALMSLILASCGEAGLLDGVGERTRDFVQGDPSPTTTVLTVIAGTGEEELVGVTDVKWFNDDLLNQIVGTPEEVVNGVWRRELKSRFVQSSRSEIALALPGIMFPDLVPESVRWVTSQLVYDLTTGALDPDTFAAFGMWVSDPYQSATARLGVMRVGKAADDLLQTRSDIVPIIVPDGISLGWTEAGYRYELFCRSDISEELCFDVANSSAALSGLLP